MIWFFTSQSTLFQLCRYWTITKEGLMWQRSDAVEAQIRNTQAFYHWATALSKLYEMRICCKTENVSCLIKQPNKENKTLTALSMLYDVFPIYLDITLTVKSRKPNMILIVCLFENNNFCHWGYKNPMNVLLNFFPTV